MEIKNYGAYFFIVILVGISILAFFILQPFLIAVLMAAILAVVFQRPHAFFLRLTGGRKNLSAFLTSFLGVLLFIGLFSLLVGLVVNEVSNIYPGGASGGDIFRSYLDPAIDSLNNNKFLRSLGVGDVVNKDTTVKLASQIGQLSLTLLQKTYQGVAHFIFLSFIMFFTLYYLLIGGRDLVKKIIYLSPLKDSHERMLVAKFISISRATVKGNLVVGFVQGAIGGITFAMVGVPSAAVWGVIMVFLSLIPMVGSSLVWFPAGVIMILIGNVWQGVVILAVGLGVISIIDNILRPELVGKDTQMHPLLVFFATLGGIGMFGFLGFIMGPMIIALFLTLWDIYAIEFKGQLKKFNS